MITFLWVLAVGYLIFRITHLIFKSSITPTVPLSDIKVTPRVFFDMVCVGPIFEEFCYRWPIIAFAWAGSFLGIGITTVIFALCHVPRDYLAWQAAGVISKAVYLNYLIRHFIWMLFIGFVLGYVTLRTDSLLYPILMHISWNFINVLLLLRRLKRSSVIIIKTKRP